MKFDTKLQPYFDEMKLLLPELSWYGAKNDMSGIDDEMAIMAYTTNKGGADGRVHFWRVTLTLYVTNYLNSTLDIEALGYDQISETQLDEKLNDYIAYNRQVLVL